MTLLTHNVPKSNNGNGHRRHYAPRGRLVRQGLQAAVARAMAAAQRYSDGTAPSYAVAAMQCGSNPQYVAAVLVLEKSGNARLIDEALAGRIPLLTAAKSVRADAEIDRLIKHHGFDAFWRGLERATAPAASNTTEIAVVSTEPLPPEGDEPEDCWKGIEE